MNTTVAIIVVFAVALTIYMMGKSLEVNHAPARTRPDFGGENLLSIFGIETPELSRDLHSDHFTNDQLQQLYRKFCMGNGLDNPDDILKIAEQIYGFNTWEECVGDPMIKTMIKDGLGPFIHDVYEMKKKLP